MAFLGDFGSFIEGLAGPAAQIISALNSGGRSIPPLIQAPVGIGPGSAGGFGGVVQTAGFGGLGAVLGGAGLGAAAGSVVDAFGGFGGGGVPMMLNDADFMAPTRSGGLRARSSLIGLHPITGNLVTYKNMGRCVLFSGDLTAAKRVRKVAGKARRAKGR